MTRGLHSETKSRQRGILVVCSALLALGIGGVATAGLAEEEQDVHTSGAMTVLETYSREVCLAKPQFGLDETQLQWYRDRLPDVKRLCARKTIAAYSYLRYLGLDDDQAEEMLLFTANSTLTADILDDACVGSYCGIEVVVPEAHWRDFPAHTLDKPHSSILLCDKRYRLCLLRYAVFHLQLQQALFERVVEDGRQLLYPEELLLPCDWQALLGETISVGEVDYVLGAPALTYSSGTIYASIVFPVSLEDLQ